jgi:integrase/recombinase XerD
MTPESSPTSISNITAQTPLVPAVTVWRYYLEDQGKSPHTVKAFLADVLLLASYLPPDRHLGEISTNELNNFLQWMQNSRGVPCSPKTLARRITSIKAFFRWLNQYGVLLVDPAEKVVQRSVISPLPEVLTISDVEALIKVANKHRCLRQPDSRYYALLILLLETGIKKSETLSLCHNHIDLEAEGGPLLFVRYASPQHRYKERKIALSDSWVQAYHEYKHQYPMEDQVFPWSPRRLEYLLEDLGKEAGLAKHVSFDMCRWTCALSDWQSGMDPNKIRQKLGISKIQWREVRMKIEQLAEAA